MYRLWMFCVVLWMGIRMQVIAVDIPDQPPGLAPRETAEGVVFKVIAPDAEKVYIAGSFNNWADNRGGIIRNESARMDGPDSEGVFRKTIPLPPGVHAYRFNIGGWHDGWFIPGYTRLKDGDTNALVLVDGIPDGDKRAAVAGPPRRTKDGVTFEFHAPNAHIVFLAGEFNRWANNRDGQVVDHRFAMNGPDQDGIWRATVKLPPGRYRYQFVINGNQWVRDPLAHSQQDHTSVVEIKP